MTTRLEIEGGVRVVHLSGELDGAAARRLLEACLGGDEQCVCVDLRQLTFMDCGGYKCLLALERELRQRGGALTLRNVNGGPRRLLVMLGHRPV